MHAWINTGRPKAAHLTIRQVREALMRAGAVRNRLSKIGKALIASEDLSSTFRGASEMVKLTREEKENLNTLKGVWDQVPDGFRAAWTKLAASPEDLLFFARDRIPGLEKVLVWVRNTTKYRTKAFDTLRNEVGQIQELAEKQYEQYLRLTSAAREADFFDVNPYPHASVDANIAADSEIRRLRAAMRAQGANKPAIQKAIARREDAIKRVWFGEKSGKGRVVFGWKDLNQAARDVFNMTNEGLKRQNKEHYDIMVENTKTMTMQDPARQKELLDKLDRLFKPSFERQTYFPAKRHGNYWLLIKDGDRAGFVTYDTAKELKAALKRERQAGSQVESGENLQELQNIISGQNVSGAFKEAMDAVDAFAVATAGGTPSSVDVNDLKESILQMYLKALPEADIRKQFVNRKYTAGFSTDFLRDYAHTGYRSAMHLTRLKMRPELERLRMQLESNSSHLRTLFAANPQGFGGAAPLGSEETALAAMGELFSRAEEEVSPRVHNDFLQTISSFGSKASVVYMLTTVRNAVMQLASLHTPAFPVLEQEYGSKATWAVATKFSKSIFGGSFFSPILKMDGMTPTLNAPEFGGGSFMEQLAKDNPDEHADLMEAFEEGYLAGAFNNTFFGDVGELARTPIDQSSARMALNEGKFGTAAVRGVAAMFDGTTALLHHSEAMSRQVVYMSVFALENARLKKQSPYLSRNERVDAAVNKALRMTNKGLLDYSNFGKSQLTRGPIGRLMFQFQTHPRQFTMMMVRNIHEIIRAVQEKDPQAGFAAARMGAGILASVFIWAGSTGLPVYGMALGVGSLIRAILDAARGEEDDDIAYMDASGDPLGLYNLDLWYRSKFVPEFFGAGGTMATKLGIPDDTANLIAMAVERGPISAITGLDFSDSMSADLVNMWFRNAPDFSKQGAGLVEMAASLIMGPTGALAESIYTAFTDIQSGRGDRAVEAFLPALYRGPVRAARFAYEGMLTKKDFGEVLPKEYFEGPKGAAALAGVAAGFTPSPGAKVQYENFRAQKIDTSLNRKVTKLYDKLDTLMVEQNQAVVSGNLEKYDDLQEDIDKAWEEITELSIRFGKKVDPVASLEAAAKARALTIYGANISQPGASRELGLSRERWMETQ